MNFNQLLTAARIALSDTKGLHDQHHLLKQAAALLYFNEAINEACRRSRLIIDRTTPAVCSYAITAGNPVVVLHPSIIKIRRAIMASNFGTPLRRTYNADLDELSPGWETHTGSTTAYVADYETGSIYLYRPPVADDSLKLVVSRLPLNPLDSLQSIPEIPEQYHAALVPYVVYKARSIENTELYHPQKAALALAEFEKEFGEKRSARDEQWENSQPFAEYE